MLDSGIPPDAHRVRLQPVQAGERIAAIDVLRGFALLGILAMNITSFAMIGAAYMIPTTFGDLSGLNLGFWWLADTLANRKFMTIFSLLFGAGVILQYQRAEHAGRPFKGFYYRRMFWLWIIGLVHVYIFWMGDILVPYAVAGLLLYPMRRLSSRMLLTWGLIILLFGSVIMLGSGFSGSFWPEEARQEFVDGMAPPPEDIEEELSTFRGSWWREIKYRAPHALEMHMGGIPFFLLWRCWGIMLLGMALFKMGLLAGDRPAVARRWLAFGLLIGLPLTIYGSIRQWNSGWDPYSVIFVDGSFGYWASIPMALGWIGLVFMAIERGRLKGLQTRLAAVGRSALSCYLLTTLICTTIFYGRGFGLFGSVPRVGQAGIVIGIWILLLLLAPAWLKRFRFGPAEWLWRSLAYWKRQPMRFESGPREPDGPAI